MLGAADSCSPSPEKPETNRAEAIQAKKTESGKRVQESQKTEPGKTSKKETEGMKQRFWRDPEIAGQLKISEEQVESLNAEARDFLSHLEKSRRIMRVSYQKLLISLSQDPVDEKAVEAAEKDFRDAGTSRYHLMTGQLSELRKILSHEQWLQLKKLRPRAFQIDRFRLTKGIGTARAFISDTKEAPAQKRDANKAE